MEKGGRAGCPGSRLSPSWARLVFLFFIRIKNFCRRARREDPTSRNGVIDHSIPEYDFRLDVLLSTSSLPNSTLASFIPAPLFPFHFRALLSDSSRLTALVAYPRCRALLGAPRLARPRLVPPGPARPCLARPGSRRSRACVRGCGATRRERGALNKDGARWNYAAAPSASGSAQPAAGPCMHGPQSTTEC